MVEWYWFVVSASVSVVLHLAAYWVIRHYQKQLAAAMIKRIQIVDKSPSVNDIAKLLQLKKDLGHYAKVSFMLENDGSYRVCDGDGSQCSDLHVLLLHQVEKHEEEAKARADRLLGNLRPETTSTYREPAKRKV